jgi:hypothetical protein
MRRGLAAGRAADGVIPRIEIVRTWQSAPVPMLVSILGLTHRGYATTL